MIALDRIHEADQLRWRGPTPFQSQTNASSPKSVTGIGPHGSLLGLQKRSAATLRGLLWIDCGARGSLTRKLSRAESMTDAAPIGRYKTPRFQYGSVVFDIVRGDVQIVALTDAPIPWPIGRSIATRGRSLIVFADLERAIRTEANQTVCRLFGVTAQTVSKWRKALGVGLTNPGTKRLRRTLLMPRLPAMRERIDYHAPERIAKISQARTGKPRPAHVVEAVRQAHIGRVASAAERQRLSDAHRKRGTRPPKAGRAWTDAEETILRTHSAPEAAKLTGRSLTACYQRRAVLKLPDGRRRD